MFYSAPWSSHPRYPFPYHPVVGVYPGNYSSNVHNWQWNNVPYAQPLAPNLRNESVPVHRDTSISKAEAELNQIWRMLWEQHVAWMRMVIISIAAGLPDEALVTERLLRNAPDMAAVIRRYYGEKNASRFSALMKEHFVLAAQLVKAAKAGNNKAASEVEKKWYANADEIAAFLSSINPHWPKPVLRKMLHEHLRLLKDEAVFRLSGNYKSDIEIYDQIEKQALEMADAFTAGIVKQFPKSVRLDRCGAPILAACRSLSLLQAGDESTWTMGAVAPWVVHIFKLLFNIHKSLTRPPLQLIQGEICFVDM